MFLRGKHALTITTAKVKKGFFFNFQISKNFDVLENVLGFITATGIIRDCHDEDNSWLGSVDCILAPTYPRFGLKPCEMAFWNGPFNVWMPRLRH